MFFEQCRCILKKWHSMCHELQMYSGTNFFRQQLLQRYTMLLFTSLSQFCIPMNVTPFFNKIMHAICGKIQDVLFGRIFWLGNLQVAAT